MTEKEIVELKQRIEQLERALWALAMHQPLGADNHGRLYSIPMPKVSSAGA